MYGDRTQLRSFIAACWQKHRQGLRLSPLETMVAEVVLLHPEYQSLLASGQAIEQDWPLDDDGGNPFLHLSLHLAVAEQLQTGVPPGLASALEQLTYRTGDRHDALHLLMGVLQQCLLDSQHGQGTPDPEQYLDGVRKLLD